MASTSETGHVKNVANFEDLISFCQGYGAAYNPAKDSLKLSQLTAQYEEADTVLNELKLGKTNFDIATNDRRNAFNDIKSLSTKIVNSFAVLVPSELAIADAKGINKKLQGVTTRKKTNESETSESEMTTKYVSTSQQSYDSQIDHFTTLVKLLEQYPTYTPNEYELSIKGLQEKLTLLKTTNTNQITTYTVYNNAMVTRNRILYHTDTGLVKTSKNVKQYIKSIFGATSSEFKQVSGIEFKTLKR
jgi:hypothetical protein